MHLTSCLSVLSYCSSFSSPTDGEYEYELFCCRCFYPGQQAEHQAVLFAAVDDLHCCATHSRGVLKQLITAVSPSLHPQT